MNLGITFLGVLWIGLLGSFAALMLKVPTDGKWLLFTAVAVTAGHDIGALVIGRLAGRSPLSSASPNKTVEGLVGGAAMALVAALLLFLFEVEPFAGNGPAGSVDKGGFFAIVSSRCCRRGGGTVGRSCSIDPQTRSGHQGHGQYVAGPRRFVGPLRRFAICASGGLLPGENYSLLARSALLSFRRYIASSASRRTSSTVGDCDGLE